MTRMIIDTDTASDDAVALVMALRHAGTEVEAITVVAGNVSLAQAVQNALYTVELTGSAVPVYAGAARPLLVGLQTAEQVHGQDGMGDLGLPLHGRRPDDEHAVDVLLRTARRYAGDITLVTLGPLTNVAIALLREPALATWVSRCVVMGGTADGRGNITPLGEYNVWADPHAAEIVMQSGLPLELVGWDVCRKYAVLDENELRGLRDRGKLGEFAVDINHTAATFARESSQLKGPGLADPIAMAIALDPSVATATATLPTWIDISDGPGRGQTIIDHTRSTGRPPNATVIFEASHEAFLACLHAGLAL